MKKIIIFFIFYSFSFASMYEEFSDFAYDKKPNNNFKIQEAKIINYLKEGQDCLEILIQANQVKILKNFPICQKLTEDKIFLNFLNNDFLEIYKNDNHFINENLKILRNIMQDIMIYYKIRYSFSKDIQDMSKNRNLAILNIDSKNGGILLYKINNQACVGIELTKHKSKMAMRIYGIENLDKECQFFIQSPNFKNLSYTKRDFKWYYLE